MERTSELGNRLRGLVFLYSISKTPKTIKNAEQDAEVFILFCILDMGQRERRGYAR